MAKKLKEKLEAVGIINEISETVEEISTVEVRLNQPSSNDGRFSLQENGQYSFSTSTLLSNEKIVEKSGHLFVERKETNATYLL